MKCSKFPHILETFRSRRSYLEKYLNMKRFHIFWKHLSYITGYNSIINDTFIFDGDLESILCAEVCSSRFSVYAFLLVI